VGLVDTESQQHMLSSCLLNLVHFQHSMFSQVTSSLSFNKSLKVCFEHLNHHKGCLKTQLFVFFSFFSYCVLSPLQQGGSFRLNPREVMQRWSNWKGGQLTMVCL